MLDDQTKEYAISLYNFIKDKFKISKKPTIKFINNQENADDILGRTGFYDPDSLEVNVFVTDRHPKDILRSLAHELIHHVQVCEGKMTPDRAAPASDPNYIMHDDYLKEIEGDAFYRGNITFREWEATLKMEKECIHEGKNNKKHKKKKVFTKPQLKSAKKLATDLEKDQGMEAGKAHRIAYAAKKKQIKKNKKKKTLKEGMDNNMADKKVEKQVQKAPVEVDVNEALKNSYVYNPDDRACNDLYSGRDELVFQELLKKFGIKK